MYIYNIYTYIYVFIYLYIIIHTHIYVSVYKYVDYTYMILKSLPSFTPSSHTARLSPASSSLMFKCV